MRVNRRRFMQFGASLAMSGTLNGLSAPSLAKNTSTGVYEGSAFGTTWRLVLVADKQPNTAIKHIRHTLNQIDASISPFRADSTLSQFNRSAARTFTNIEAPLSNIIRTSLATATLSNGAYDPTVGPLVNRFGFGPIKGNEHCDYRDIQCTQHTLTKQKSGVTLDLCGLGKGYAVDRVSQALQQAGYQNFLFDIGGEMIGIGYHPAGRSWTVAVEPANNATQQTQTVALTNTSIATSGLRHNGFVYKGQAYGHLIDRNKNTLAKPKCHSVSVMHTSATLADAWSTALFVAGPVRGLELARQKKLSALFLPTNDVNERIFSTGLFLNQVIEG